MSEPNEVGVKTSKFILSFIYFPLLPADMYIHLITYLLGTKHYRQ